MMDFWLFFSVLSMEQTLPIRPVDFASYIFVFVKCGDPGFGQGAALYKPASSSSYDDDYYYCY